MARVHTDVNIRAPNGGTTTAGYILWCVDRFGAVQPSSGVSPSGTPACIWAVACDNSEDIPKNTAAAPFGSFNGTPGGSSRNVYAIRTPAAELLDDRIIQDANTVAACMEFKYTGKEADRSGEVAIIRGLSAQQMLHGNANYSDEPMSVDDLFNFAEKITPMRSVDVVHRPHADSHKYRTNTSGATMTGVTGAFPSTVYNLNEDDDIQVIGIAFRGLSYGSGAVATGWQLSARLTSVINWRPGTVKNLSHEPVKTVGPPMVDKTLGFLDKHLPGWTERVKGGVIDLATRALESKSGKGLPMIAFS